MLSLRMSKLKRSGITKEARMSFYDFAAIKMSGQEVDMQDYKGKVVIVVNTASKCGLTRQFAGLEALYTTYKDQGLEILGFPTNQFGHGDAEENESIERSEERRVGKECRSR